ncbi:hypothetical protein ACW7BJ_24390, partial [Azospirillum argentinense]
MLKRPAMPVPLRNRSAANGQNRRLRIPSHNTVSTISKIPRPSGEPQHPAPNPFKEWAAKAETDEPEIRRRSKQRRVLGAVLWIVIRFFDPSLPRLSAALRRWSGL